MSASFILTCHSGFARIWALIRIIASSRSVRIGATGTRRSLAKGSGKAAVSDNVDGLPLVDMVTRAESPRRAARSSRP